MLYDITKNLIRRQKLSLAHNVLQIPEGGDYEAQIIKIV